MDTDIQRKRPKLFNNNTSKKSNITCYDRQNCGQFFRKLIDYIHHLKYHHYIVLEEKTLNFDNDEGLVYKLFNPINKLIIILLEFLNWKMELESETITNYVTKFGNFRSKSGHVRTFVCNRNGKGTDEANQSLRKRKPRKNGSRKTTNSCPAVIYATTDPNTEMVKVEFYGTHLDHKNEVEHVDLTDKEKQIICFDLIETGMNKKAVIKKYTKIPAGSVRRKINTINLRTLNNIIREFDLYKHSKYNQTNEGNQQQETVIKINESDIQNMEFVNLFEILNDSPYMNETKMTENLRTHYLENNMNELMKMITDENSKSVFLYGKFQQVKIRIMKYLANIWNNVNEQNCSYIERNLSLLCDRMNKKIVLHPDQVALLHDHDYF
ncbi:hypothetical protein RDWZM_006383 [Blomia tropicalis]|uniref:C2H2-type domain-containing protein n=1 Tax=Blomia tropicalis TaxID=40697 RepID=A0A9Q0RPA3_BLOTA|nr:hypothetical protein RDWZM_006383 [Blomia tropicalis]